jgi:hypothetical protein
MVILTFDCLSISHEQRDVITALAETRTDRSVVFDDIVAGKGERSYHTPAVRLYIVNLSHCANI